MLLSDFGAAASYIFSYIANGFTFFHSDFILYTGGEAYHEAAEYRNLP